MRRGIFFWIAAVLLACPAGVGFADDGENGMSTPKVGGDVRFRGEYKRPFNYVDADGGDPTGDDGTYMRTRVHMTWQLANEVSVFLQAQDSRAWGTDDIAGSGADADVDMKQAYVLLSNLQGQHGMDFLGENDVDLYVGRQEVPEFGDGYILAKNEWANTGPTAFDGLWFDTAFGGEEMQFNIDLLIADLANNDAYSTGAIGPSEGAVFWGIQAGTDDINWVGGDVYFWNFDGDFSSFVDFDVQIYGVRLYTNLPDGTLEGFKAVFEYAMESGDLGSSDVDANFMLLRGEYALDVENLNPVFGLGISIASGDGDPSDSDVETWFSPLDVNHNILGHYDLVDNSNVQDIFITSRISMNKSLNLHLDLHMLSFAEEEDDWYTVSGGSVAGAAAHDDDLGMEIDLYAVWNCGNNLLFRGGYSRFMAGDGVEDKTGGYDDDGDFFYIQLTVPFGYQGGMTAIDPPK